MVLYGVLLETFLGGMETDFGVVTNPDGSVLETFLGGMETGLPSLADGKGVASLKPSLVEWKPWRTTGKWTGTVVLETFLGGMETSSISLT